VERYLDLMGRDKKVVAGSIRFVLLRGIGHAFVAGDVPEADLRKVLEP
jgi:3-dehydroquinate synthase